MVETELPEKASNASASFRRGPYRCDAEYVRDDATGIYFDVAVELFSSLTERGRKTNEEMSYVQSNTDAAFDVGSPECSSSRSR